MISMILAILAGIGFIALICVARTARRDPWRRAVDGLNALVDAGIDFSIALDGTLTNWGGDEVIEFSNSAGRWVLTHHTD